MKTRLLLLCLLMQAFALAAPPNEEGKTIFLARCAGCHNVNKVLTGPALAGVDQRRSLDWIIRFVHSSQGVIQSGDRDAVALFNQFNQVHMPDHPDLTDQNIRDIVAYVQAEAVAQPERKAPFRTPGKYQKPYLPISLTDYPVFGTFLLAVALLIGVLLFAVRVKGLARKE